ncbi:methylmalonyl Co-A mutase-associated GTPase MeaB [Flavobacteriaceae bacterium Ap0902]|nr:methylmalonyl Co-A mutase-associated GTPase MeaB [Flavobacteriaceae bacterium Ap0902]
MKTPTVDDFANLILSGNITALSKAITLAESKKIEHQMMAQQLIHQLLSYTGESKRIAITGVPGAGKSTFIESFGMFLIEKGHKVAVLAVDPSSTLSKGSILGDKTRMEDLSRSSKAYIRPSATGGSLGGITARTSEALLLCEAAGFDIILVETVGVGQSEILVDSITDFFLFIQVSGTGDELQGIKRGIMEMADVIFLNKIDLYNEKIVTDTRMNLNRSLQFLPSKPSGWKRKILKGSAYTNKGISEVWDKILEYYEITRENGYLDQKRWEQKNMRIDDYLEELILLKLKNKSTIQSQINGLKRDLRENKISPFEIAKKLIDENFPNL